MLIGVIKEIKPQEYRVALTPSAAKQVLDAHHHVLVEYGAGTGSGYSDMDYTAAGCEVVEKEEVLARCKLLLKVKEPLPEEYLDYKAHHILFTYLHLAANPNLVEALVQSKATCIAYESVVSEDGSLPLLVPMSQIAGRLSTQIGADLLLKHRLGKGILLGGVPGGRPGKVVVIGGGIVGEEAARIASGLGAMVVILEINQVRINTLSKSLPKNVVVLYATPHTIQKEVLDADLVIGAVLIPNGKSPILVDEKLVSKMQSGSVIVDVAVDQGGCIATSEVTSHETPVVIKHGVLHYGVPNMPGAVPKTATEALVNTTLPYILEVAKSEGNLSLLPKEVASAINIAQGTIF